MKFRWNKSYLGWGLTALAVIVAAALVLTMIWNYKDVSSSVGNFLSALNPILYGFIFAYLLNPIVMFLENRCFSRVFKKADLPPAKETEERFRHLKVYVKNKPRRILSITLTIVVFLILLIGLFIAVIPQLADTISVIINNIPSYINNIINWVQQTFSAYPEISEEVTSMISNAGSTLRSFLSSAILPQMGDYLGFLTNSIMDAVGFIMNLIFGIVVGIYCLYSKELFAAQAKKVVYCVLNVKHGNRLIQNFRKINNSFGSFITGTLLDSFLVGCITMVITTLSGVPFSLLVSVIMGVTNIIPYFGPFIGLVPSLLLIFMEDPIMCIPFTVIVLIIQNVNGNILSPKILSGSTGLTSFWVIFAILAGQGIFGFWGLIIGIPIFAVLYETLKTFIKSKLERKGLPSDSDHYTDIVSFTETELEPVSLHETLSAEREKKRQYELEQKRLREEKGGGIIAKAVKGIKKVILKK